MSSGADPRPGVAYRRPDGDPDRLEIESAGDPAVPVDDLPNDAWLEAVHPEDRDRLREELAAGEVDVAYRVDHDGDDDPTWIHEHGRRVEAGDVIGYLLPAYERIERQRRLEQQRERLEEFASVVSHDLRNPLSVAVGNLELARGFDGEEAVDRIDRAHDALDRMDVLISDLLSLAREGRSVEATAETDLRAVVDRAWATVGRPANAELVVEEPLPRIECDHSRLRQALENLFRNAIEHGSAEGLAADAASVDGDAVAARRVDADGVRVFVGRTDGGFYVADDGSGIPEDDREAVFEPGHTTAEEGTGFGLAIVERIAEAHGWSVSVTESRAGGARFEFAGVESHENPGGAAGDDAASGTAGCDAGPRSVE
ncbi:sensor histidine kinase [Halorubrum halodurans]|uniref:histidine kinase n=1 Tax=Halorubrum halodurans TaxID=1383851 RepID=A0A256INA6_9EURY|nr:PAS domain-containing sensor histidine kinase [Halorubrum halodurans]OYR58001.1 sensor histidine kinase [Halorubrum halodurans]